MVARIYSTDIIKTLNLGLGEEVYALLNHLLVMCSPTSYASSDMHAINGFLIDRTEILIADFQRFASAAEFVSQAERAGGGEVYA